MKIAKGDRLLTVRYTTGADEAVLTTVKAQAIRFSEKDVPTQGLAAGGVRGIKLLGQSDRVVGAFLANDALHSWNITEDGVAKISSMEEYPVQRRGGSGKITMRLPESSREVAAAAIGKLNDTVLVLTSRHKAKYMSLGLAETVKRGRAGGSSVIALRKNEAVIAVVEYRPKIAAAAVADSLPARDSVLMPMLGGD